LPENLNSKDRQCLNLFELHRVEIQAHSSHGALSRLNNGRNGNQFENKAEFIIVTIYI
jgi:hypothetical protein